MNSKQCLLIAGFGDLGARLAQRRVQSGEQIIGLRRRSAERIDGIRQLSVDLTTGEGFSQLPRRPDALVFCAAPDERNEPAYRRLYLDGLRRLLDRIEVARVLFVSSTAVYGEDDGQWLDEQTPAQTQAFNGRVLLEAEVELATHPGACVLRLSGLYGPGREALLRRARVVEPGRARWSNRIHMDDASDALSLLLDLPSPERCYLGNDDEPALDYTVMNWLREREQLAPVAFDTEHVNGRRVSNRRLRAAGWQPTYPDYRSGYAALLA